MTKSLGIISLHTKYKELKKYFYGFLSHCCWCIYPGAGHPPSPEGVRKYSKQSFPWWNKSPTEQSETMKLLSSQYVVFLSLLWQLFGHDFGKYVGGAVKLLTQT